MDFIQDLITQHSQKLSNALDDKFKDACKLWGLDINNHDELKRRCRIMSTEGEELKSFMIDEHLVFYFTGATFSRVNYSTDKDKTMSVTMDFKITETLSPSHYNITK